MDQLNREEENNEDEFITLLEDWAHLQRVAITLCYVYTMTLLLSQRITGVKDDEGLEPETSEQREEERINFLRGLRYDGYCTSVIRMTPIVFHSLCQKLKLKGLLQATRQASIEEQVAKFLIILSHQMKNRTVSFFFRRSGETTSRHFHKVLQAILALNEEYLIQPTGKHIPPEILDDTRFFPYFKDCVGAIDGTHIRANVPVDDAPRYRGRKDYPTQNVLAACNFNLQFTYVLSGWEGTAADSRIIKNALKRTDKLIIPPGKYYLVDAGFMLRSGLITPYRGERYHLKEFSSQAPRNPKELFNLRHASLRNAIERAFGVLKKRFPIIGSTNEKTFPYETQCAIVDVCCILHNFIMSTDPDRELILEVDRELERRPIIHEISGRDDSRIEDAEDISRGVQLRDSIANQMWLDYSQRI